jgi:hypothetical protein
MAIQRRNQSASKEEPKAAPEREQRNGTAKKVFTSHEHQQDRINYY